MKAAAATLLVIVVVALAIIVWRRSDGDNVTGSRSQAPATAAQQTTTPTRIPPFSPALIQRLAGFLRDAGVEVLPDATVFERGDASGVTGFAVSEFQVRNMAVEIGGDAGGGFYGVQLEEIAEMPEGAPTISFFVAAWIVRAASPAARAAADLMGPRDYTRAREIVFPSVVLAAFVGDAVRAASADSSVTPAAVLRRYQRYAATLPVMSAGLLAQGGGSNPCTLISNFVSGMLAVVFDKLKIDTDVGGVVGFFVDLYNTAVDLAKTVITGLLEVMAAPVLTALKVAIGLVGVASYASSMLRPWAVRVQADPSPNRYAIDDEPAPTGVFTARIDDKGFPGWPPTLVQCAKAVNVDLPSPDADVGSPVRWSPLGGARSVLERGARDETLPASKVARLGYTVVGRETAADAGQGKEINDTVTVQVGFERRAISALKEQLKGMFFGMIPGQLAFIVKPLLSPITDKVLNNIAKFVDANGSAILTVKHHALVRCRLFTVPEARQTLKQEFNVVAAVGPTGCAVGIKDGPNVGYKYDRLPCRTLKASVALLGVNDVPLGPGSFYFQRAGLHVVAFQPISAPGFCVHVTSGPANAIAGRDVIRLAALMRPRS